MSPDCNEHRKSMELLALKILLEKGMSDPIKKEEVLNRIEVLEKELEMD